MRGLVASQSRRDRNRGRDPPVLRRGNQQAQSAEVHQVCRAVPTNSQRKGQEIRASRATDRRTRTARIRWRQDGLGRRGARWHLARPFEVAQTATPWRAEDVGAERVRVIASIRTSGVSPSPPLLLLIGKPKTDEWGGHAT